MSSKEIQAQDWTGGKATRVVIVAHGSRARGWVAALRDWHRGVVDHVEALSPGPPPVVELTFLEIAEPLLETRLEQLAREDTAVLVVPFFLSRSGHAGDDVPRIAEEKLAGRAPFRIAPVAGWEAVLGSNAERRLRAAGARPGDPVIVSGYGASHHDDLWRDLVRAVQSEAGAYSGGAPWLWAPSGHFLEDYAEPLRQCLASIETRHHGSMGILPMHGKSRAGAGAALAGCPRSRARDRFPNLRSVNGPRSSPPVGPLPGSGAILPRIPRLKSGARFVASLPGRRARSHATLARAGGKSRAAILPLYLSVSTYQKELIPGVLAEFPGLEVAFAPDAILPDAAVEEWMARHVLSSLQQQTV